MADIDFDEPSVGQVNSTRVALEITNNRRGGCLRCISPQTGVGTRSEGGTGVIGVTKSISGTGVMGEAQNNEGGVGVMGKSKRWVGVRGQSNGTLDVNANIVGVGVWGESFEKGGIGVFGESYHQEGGAGVIGKSKSWIGTYGESETSAGVVGISKKWVGVHGAGTEKGGHGVYGEAQHPEGGAGVIGKSKNWIGTYGESETSAGVFGTTKTWLGVAGTSTEKGGHGVYGEAQHPQGGTGVFGKSTNWIGVYGESQNVGVYGKAPIAGFFEGEVQVTGDIRLLGADCAEEFDVSCVDIVEPGTVMVLSSSSEGVLEPSSIVYDKRVAGVASGAGGFKPGIVLDNKQLQGSYKNKRRIPVALMGKVYCKVDASYSPIEVGDLLTTSPTEGHAMKATDPIKAFGTVIGKALKPLKEGKGLIPLLIALQ